MHDAHHILIKLRFLYFHQYKNKYMKKFVDTCDVCKILKCKMPKPISLKQTSLNEKFNYWGFPSVLSSDNALGFTSDALMQFSSIYSIKKTQVVPYSPFSKSVVERNDTKIRKLLKLYVHNVEHRERYQRILDFKY